MHFQPVVVEAVNKQSESLSLLVAYFKRHKNTGANCCIIHNMESS